jgi:hypothetical protein
VKRQNSAAFKLFLEKVNDVPMILNAMSRRDLNIPQSICMYHDEDTLLFLMRMMGVNLFLIWMLNSIALHQTKNTLIKFMEMTKPDIFNKVVSRHINEPEGLSAMVVEMFFTAPIEPEKEFVHLIAGKFLTDDLIYILLPGIFKKIRLRESLYAGNPDFMRRLFQFIIKKPAYSLSVEHFQLIKKIVSMGVIEKIDLMRGKNYHLQNISMLYSYTSLAYWNNALYHHALESALTYEVPTSSFTQKHDIVRDLETKIQQNNVLLKIVKYAHHYDFIMQLTDYQYRPKLRYFVNGAYKYVHATNQVVPYLIKRNKNKPPYTHTKKHPPRSLQHTCKPKYLVFMCNSLWWDIYLIRNNVKSKRN